MTVSHATIEELRMIVDSFDAVTWPVPKSEMYAVADALGWSLISDREKGMTYAVSFAFGRARASIGVLDGMISEARIGVSSKTEDGDAADAKELALAYVDVKSVIEGFLGQPAHVHRGAFPKASWDLDNRGRVAVTRLSNVVSLIVVHEKFADVERFEESRGIPGDRDPLADSDA